MTLSETNKTAVEAGAGNDSARIPGRKKKYETKREMQIAKNRYHKTLTYKVKNRARYHVDFDYRESVRLQNRKANERKKRIMLAQAVVRGGKYLRAVMNEPPIVVAGEELITRKRFLELISRSYPTLVRWRAHRKFTVEEVHISVVRNGRVVPRLEQIAYRKKDLIQFIDANREYVGLTKTS